MARFRDEIIKLVALGVEGLECYYPTHTEAVKKACLDVCQDRELLVTAGSDCHGAFGKTAVGEGRVPIDNLRLNDICFY